MNDKEYLKHLKEFHDFGEEWEGDLSDAEIDWLIEQAEAKQRYEETLQKIVHNQTYGIDALSKESIVGNVGNLARQALEESE